MDPLTVEQCEAIVQACLRNTEGWTPSPGDLPTAERLRERGVLKRTFVAGEVFYARARRSRPQPP
jgi:hypothetical protein